MTAETLFWLVVGIAIVGAVVVDGFILLCVIRAVIAIRREDRQEGQPLE